MTVLDNDKRVTSAAQPRPSLTNKMAFVPIPMSFLLCQEQSGPIRAD